MQAVILAGGAGTRLAERLNGRPKPLIDVCGVPLLERQVLELKSWGVDDFVVLVNHRAEQIASFFRERDDFGVKVTLIDDGEPRGTAGALLACLDVLAERFLVVYGDTLFKIDLDRFLDAHARSGAAATLFLHPNDHPADSDLVEIDEDGWITAFHGYPHPADAILPNLVNAAFYAVERSALEAWNGFRVPADFAKDLFPAMLGAGARLHGYRSFEYVKDLGTPKRLDKVERHLSAGVLDRAVLTAPQACVFVDRDGTLNVQRDYVRSPEELVLLPGVAEAVRRLNEAEHRVAVVTNQPVIARGDCSFADLRRIHAKLETELGRQGAFVDGIYFCPHHPDSGYAGEVAAYKISCDCRKPMPGLIEQASRDLNADRARAWMIGDSTADLLAARRAGVTSIAVLTGEAGRDGKHAAVADFTVPDFPAAVALILEDYSQLETALQPLDQTIGPGDLVLLGGLARSGKSTAAAVLERRLRRRGLTVVRLSLDGWIKPLGDRGAPGVQSRFELELVARELAPWLAGEDAEIRSPFYERRSRTRRSGDPVRIAAEAVLIVEGVPALLPDLATDRQVHRVYLDAAERSRRDRLIADLVQRGATIAEAEAAYRERQEDETPVVQASRRRADLVLTLDSVLETQTA